MIRVPIRALSPAFDPMQQSVRLPWPPSVNAYWRTVTRVREGRRWRNLPYPRHLISAEGKAYREEAILVLRMARLVAYQASETVIARLFFYLPDLRRRDVDNLPKAVFDALQAGGIVVDDEQIRRTWSIIVPPGHSPPGVRVDLARLV